MASGSHITQETCQQHLECKGWDKAWQSVTDNRFGRVCGHKIKKYPPSVANNNVSGSDLLGVKWIKSRIQSGGRAT